MFDSIFGSLMKMAGFCVPMKDYDFNYDSQGLPKIEDCQKNSFFIYYTSPESFALFRALYKNNFGLQDKYVAYWKTVTQSLSSNQFVIGFDPFNEPMPSWNDFGDLLNTVFPGHFDQNNLTPLYERIYADYQAVDSENIMFFEPGQFPDEVPGLVFHLGFETPPGGVIGSSTHVLNDHTYCCQLSPSICAETGEPHPDTAEKCFNWHQQRITKRDEDA